MTESRSVFVEDLGKDVLDAVGDEAQREACANEESEGNRLERHAAERALVAHDGRPGADGTSGGGLGVLEGEALDAPVEVADVHGALAGGRDLDGRGVDGDFAQLGHRRRAPLNTLAPLVGRERRFAVDDQGDEGLLLLVLECKSDVVPAAV
jgi:hypothetical protein